MNPMFIAQQKRKGDKKYQLYKFQKQIQEHKQKIENQIKVQKQVNDSKITQINALQDNLKRQQNQNKEQGDQFDNNLHNKVQFVQQCYGQNYNIYNNENNKENINLSQDKQNIQQQNQNTISHDNLESKKIKIQKNTKKKKIEDKQLQQKEEVNKWKKQKFIFGFNNSYNINQKEKKLSLNEILFGNQLKEKTFINNNYENNEILANEKQGQKVYKSPKQAQTMKEILANLKLKSQQCKKDEKQPQQSQQYNNNNNDYNNSIMDINNNYLDQKIQLKKQDSVDFGSQRQKYFINVRNGSQKGLNYGINNINQNYQNNSKKNNQQESFILYSQRRQNRQNFQHKTLETRTSSEVFKDSDIQQNLGQVDGWGIQDDYEQDQIWENF
ncbi:hypothetical protein PPERSA_08990 [Pseudocohnilembus persalinus]|uniref:Uncharacterized protein n=1 Tax=Pseudocohnilembus persalinus TaxID=266149 RepID=A0A0V0R2Z6_PSEPJ|nr:hypothetical protein PPERSA_08990 [Pseudocohnilembus persalinus]|eukprot:KRX08886.1 hypothetical protein PPERSA_08990 [Pseudocohnilembus persalinus]